MANKQNEYSVIFSGATLIRVDDGRNQEYHVGDHFKKNLIHMASPTTKIDCSKIGGNFCRDAGDRQLINSDARFTVKEVRYEEMGKDQNSKRTYDLPIDDFFSRGKPSRLELRDETFIID